MVVQVKYRYKEGFRCGIPIEKTVAVMNGLAEQNRLTAKDLVEVSKDEDAPLHNYFEWDNEKCGEKWREQQGRVLIANIVVQDVEDEKSEPVRAFFQIENETSLYEPLTVIIKDEDKLQSLYDTAKRELKSFQKKYSRIKAFAGLFKEIDQLPDKAS